MGTNVLLKHYTVPASNFDGSTTSDSPRTLTIHSTMIDEVSQKLISADKETIVGATPKQSYASGRYTTRIVDILRLTSSWEIQGQLYTDDAARTTLNGAINNSVTTITLTSASLVENASSTKPSYVLIDNEVIKYTGKNGNDITGCSRGWGSTTAASHSNGADVKHPAYHFKEQLVYIFEAGGSFHMLYPGSLSLDNTIGDVDFSTTDLTTLRTNTATGMVYTVNMNKLSVKEVPDDNVIPLRLDVIVTVMLGVTY